MLTHLTQTLTTLITNLYVTTGLVGIIIAMAIESCCIPLPSELVMPIAGIMITQGKITSRHESYRSRSDSRRRWHYRLSHRLDSSVLDWIRRWASIDAEIWALRLNLRA